MKHPHLNRPSRTLLATALATVIAAGSALAQAPITTPAPVSAAQDIRDIRGPKPLEASWLLPALAAAIAVGVGTGCAAWALGRRRKRRVKRPHEIALDGLESARSLMREGSSREFSIAVSGIVREYIENAFGFIATHLTTHEFLSELLQSTDAAIASNRPLLADFLESCDLAKFGGWNLTLPAMNDMYESASRFVIESAAAQAQRGASNSRPTQSTPTTTDDTYDSLPTT
jgi:hypothetical protein